MRLTRAPRVQRAMPLDTERIAFPLPSAGIRPAIAPSTVAAYKGPVSLWRSRDTNDDALLAREGQGTWWRTRKSTGTGPLDTDTVPLLSCSPLRHEDGCAKLPREETTPLGHLRGGTESARMALADQTNPRSCSKPCRQIGRCFANTTLLRKNANMAQDRRNCADCGRPVLFEDPRPSWDRIGYQHYFCYCSQCYDKAIREEAAQEKKRLAGRTVVKSCGSCDGTGRVKKYKCEACNGRGTYAHKEIPPPTFASCLPPRLKCRNA